MVTNTTKTIEKTSTALGEKCVQTERRMKRLMAEAGCEQYETEQVTIPAIPGSKDDVIFVGMNGARFYFMRGKKVTMPCPLAEILRNAGVM